VRLMRVKIHIGIIFMFIGLALSSGILIANNRGIIIDTLATDMDVPAWELAFSAYMLFFIGGIMVQMLSEKRKGIDNSDYLNVFITILSPIISMYALTGLAHGSIVTDATSMLVEFQAWYEYFAIVIVVYIGWFFIIKR